MAEPTEEVGDRMTPGPRTAAPPRSYRSLMRQISSIVEATVVVSASLIIAACSLALGVLATDPELGEEWTGGLRPIQFYKELEAERLDAYTGLFAVAHNSGDDVGSTLEALSYGADVIEVDVIAVDGRLYAAHGPPVRWIGQTLFRGPPLERIWLAAAGADAVKLDLKESSPAFVDLVIRFLETRRGQRQVIVVSPSPDVLRLFAERHPEALRFLSVGSTEQFRRLEEDTEVIAVIDGVSVSERLLTKDRAAWLEERSILTSAWTVNDLDRVNELVERGVDAITTDNLAIMKLLGGQQRGERWLTRLRPGLPLAPTPSTNR